MIEGRDLVLVSRGHSRTVYGVRGKPELLVKVSGGSRQDRSARRVHPVTRLKRRLFGTSYRYIMREYSAYCRAMRRAEAIGAPPPIAHLHGLALTREGLGQLVQNIRSADGRPAPTLRELARRGQLSAEVVAALNAFVAAVFRSGLVVHDLSSRNIVYESWRGRNRCVLVDGFGDKTLVPVLRLVPALNRRRIERDLHRLGAQLGLSWDCRSHTFAAD